MGQEGVWQRGRRATLVWQDPNIPEFLEHLPLIRSQAPNNGYFNIFLLVFQLKKKKNFT